MSLFFLSCQRNLTTTNQQHGKVSGKLSMEEGQDTRARVSRYRFRPLRASIILAPRVLVPLCILLSLIGLYHAECLSNASIQH
jgi:hypothetical protein